MKYILCEGTSHEAYSASGKARNDALKILEQEGYQPLSLETQSLDKDSSAGGLLSLITTYKNTSVWKKVLSSMEEGDVLAVQYPLIHPCLRFENVLVQARKKGLKTIAIVHDMTSLHPENIKYDNKDDQMLLPLFDVVICHNDQMAEVSKQYGCRHVVPMEFCDYLRQNNPPRTAYKPQPSVIIAGNLNPKRSPYLNDLGQIRIPFNLYGAGFSPENESRNVRWMGKFSPEVLPSRLEGQFGLIWDGDSVENCQGSNGGYLYYENPHKASLYAAAGIPLAAQKGTASAEFIEKENMGITINSLYELPLAAGGLSKREYDILRSNARRVGDLCAQGHYLKEANKKALQILEIQ